MMVPDASIDRVRVRARAAQTSAAIAGLEQADWPRVDAHEWVFVRSVTVRATMPWIGRHAAGSVGEKIRTAVPGGAVNASDADAIRFCSLTDLLAWLSADLAAGRAARRWYWRRWMRLFELPVGEALASLWEEHVDYLPAVIAELGQHGKLASVWRQLDAETAERLTLALVRMRAPSAADTLLRPQYKRRFAPVSIPRYQQQRWRAPLAGLNVQDTRVTLAALLVCLETRPATLLADGGQRIAAVASRLVTDTVPETAAPETPPGRSQTEVAEVRTPAQAGRIGPRSASAAVPTADSPTPARAELAERSEPPVRDPSTDAPDNRSLVRDGSEAKSIAPAVTEATRTAATLRESPATAAPGRTVDLDDDSPLSFGREFLTQEGGLFYLVNVLCRAEVRALFDQLGAWQAVPNGWVWLRALGEAFGLDASGPMAEFLEEQIGMADGDEFDRPEPQQVAQVVTLATHLYQDFDVEFDDLLPVFARVCLTESHLDIHLPSSAICLPVRLAGLDINPGWVDWLGRVVTFHYVAEGSPALPENP